MIYVHKQVKGYYQEIKEELNPKSYHVGSTFSDFCKGFWVPLSEDQLAFRSANPTASVQQVIEMRAPLAVTPESAIEPFRHMKLSELQTQDQSVNYFYITKDGVQSTMYFDKATRAVFMSNIVAFTANDAETSIWSIDDPSIEVKITIEKAKEILIEYEKYSKLVYDTTQRHKNNIQKETDIEVLKAYDVTAGYPEIISFVIS